MKEIIIKETPIIAVAVNVLRLTVRTRRKS